MHTIIHIGAGEGACLAEWLQGNAQRIVLVEPHPVLAERLRGAALGHSHVDVVEAAVAGKAGTGELLEYNLPQASGLHEPGELKKLFPGLRLLQRYPVTLVSPLWLFEEYCLEDKQAVIRLVLHAPGEEDAIIQALKQSDRLSRVSELRLSASTVPFRSDAPKIEQSLACLETYGFELVDHNTEDPDWQTWTLHLDPLKRELVHLQQALEAQRTEQQENEKKLRQRLQKAQAESSELKQKCADTAKQHDEQAKARKAAEAKHAELDRAHTALQQTHGQLEQTHDSLTSRFEETRQKLEQTHGWFLKRKQQAEAQAGQLQELEAERDTLAAENTQLKKRLDDLNRQLKAQQQGENTTQERFAELESKLDLLFGEQRSYIQQTTSALGQHVTRSAKQQRDEQALASYLAQGQVPFTTPLPADYALELLKRYRQQSYDVVIVMGSADTTQLLAHAACTERGHHQALASTHSQARQAGGTTSSVALSADDLPQAIVSLEHRKAECEALQQALTKQQHRAAVNVVHAPWVECQHQGQSALFYACASHLERLNGWLEADANVLVVIGDALAEAGHSCQPALSQLMQHLPTQTLDVVVEGASYPQESELKTKWRFLLDARQREAGWHPFGGALRLRVEG